jgi:hypothetical protein
MAAILGTICLSGVASPAHATFQKGAELYRDCSASEIVELSYCLGFIVGVADSLTGGPLNGFRACIRPSTTAEQVRAIVMEGLKKNPSERRYPAFNVIAKYLSEAFPCKSPAPARGRTPPRVRT